MIMVGLGSIVEQGPNPSKSALKTDLQRYGRQACLLPTQVSPHKCSEILRSVRNLLCKGAQMLKRREQRDMVLHVLMVSK